MIRISRPAHRADGGREPRLRRGFAADSAAGAEARSERDEPKLCPDPDRDVPHGASERAIAYQEQISRLNNPQRPLPAGMAVSLENPLTGKNVAFDDCRESDGTMIEAKGPGYAGLVKSGFLAEKIWNEDWSLQADRQLAVAIARHRMVFRRARSRRKSPRVVWER